MMDDEREEEDVPRAAPRPVLVGCGQVRPNVDDVSFPPPSVRNGRAKWNLPPDRSDAKVNKQSGADGLVYIFAEHTNFTRPSQIPSAVC